MKELGTTIAAGLIAVSMVIFVTVLSWAPLGIAVFLGYKLFKAFN